MARSIQFHTISKGDPDSTPNLSAVASAKATLGIDLQGTSPSNQVAIATSVSDVVDLTAWTKGPITATSTSNVAEQGNVGVTNGRLSGDVQTTITEDVTAYLSASHVLIHLQVTDTFDLGLTGRGYSGVSLTTASTSTNVINVSATGSSSSGNPGTFNLAKFMAVVLGTTQWNISFAGSSCGETLLAAGYSVRTVSADAEVLSGSLGSSVLSRSGFRDTDTTSFIFDKDTRSFMTGRCGPNDIVPVAVATHYSGLSTV